MTSVCGTVVFHATAAGHVIWKSAYMHVIHWLAQYLDEHAQQAYAMLCNLSMMHVYPQEDLTTYVYCHQICHVCWLCVQCLM